uniref:Ankyrin repeat protein n=1 Tax=Pithovirus LCPAC302 TaxID=2506593 RepID=A0A481Z7M9_9VIRU|nr:MAG: ankyrin repeat protein [Pithovirus LCPAC302]
MENLDKLDPNLLFLIALELDNPEIIKLCQTSKRFNQKICENNKFWLQKIRSDYPILITSDGSDRDINRYKGNRSYRNYYAYLYNRKDGNIHDILVEYSGEGKADLLKIFIKDPRLNIRYGKKFIDKNSKALFMAVFGEHLEVLKILLDDGRVDPSAHDNFAIRLASGNGYTEMVKLLLKDSRVDPSADNNEAIEKASENGYVEVVKLLLKDLRVDPSANNNKSIFTANLQRHKDVVKLLLDDPRVFNSLSEHMKKKLNII